MDNDHFSNLSFPCPKEAPHEIWATLAQRLQIEKLFEILNIFPILIYGAHTMQTWPRHKKVKCQCTTIILAILIDLLSPMICVKTQPQGILGSGEEDF